MTAPLPSPAQVIDAAARVGGVSVDDVLGDDRCVAVASARQVAASILRDPLGFSFKRIALELGYRAHSPCVDACRLVRQRPDLARLRAATLAALRLDP